MISNPIITGVKLPALTNPGTAADLLTGKQLIDANGNALAGAMPNATQATPSISVSAGGLITASAVQTAGYVGAGTKTATKQLAVQAAATVTPGTSAKTAVAAGRYTTGAVTVAGDSNLAAANIVKGKSIFGVSGSAPTATILQLTESNCSLSFSAKTVYITIFDLPTTATNIWSLVLPVRYVTTDGMSCDGIVHIQPYESSALGNTGRASIIGYAITGLSEITFTPSSRRISFYCYISSLTANLSGGVCGGYVICG